MVKGRTIVVGMLLAGALCAQHAEPPAPTERRAPTPATHAAHPVVTPLLAWQHVKEANAAYAAARSTGSALPPLPERPASTGRYVCATLVCADADFDVPALLGLRRADVLLISVPGPFVTPEAVALLERAVADEHVPLVLVLGHAECRSLAPRDPKAPADALARRVDTLREQARLRDLPTDDRLAASLVQIQREQLLAASDALRERVLRDDLRVLPGTIDARTHAIAWHHRRVDAMPLAPVK